MIEMGKGRKAERETKCQKMDKTPMRSDKLVRDVFEI